MVTVKPDATEADVKAAEDKAKAIAERVRKAPATFAEVAKKESQDPGSAVQGGDLGFFGRGRMVPAFDAVAFATPAGQISEIVETPYGFHVIKVEEKREAGTKPLDAVKDEIVATLRRPAVARSPETCRNASLMASAAESMGASAMCARHRP